MNDKIKALYIVMYTNRTKHKYYSNINNYLNYLKSRKDSALKIVDTYGPDVNAYRNIKDFNDIIEFIDKHLVIRNGVL